MFSLEPHILSTPSGRTREARHWQIMKEIDGRKFRIGYLGKAAGSVPSIIRPDLVKRSDHEKILQLCEEKHGVKPAKVYEPPKPKEPEKSEDLSDYE